MSKKTLTPYVRHTREKANGNKKKEETDKVTNRLRHKKLRKFANKPHYKILHSFDSRTPPALKTQKITRQSRKKEESQLIS